ncbi:MAG: hypothetical protein JWN56_130 [Sphingobacteriales bacterium]|nr:hypothetical protein [Sphingobacteriales bacterium]
MEILRRLYYTSIFVFFVSYSYAQSDAALQKAFRNSYANENKKDYQAAIADVAPYYSEKSYEVNIRLGWLNYVNKNYNASQTYYSRAVNLKPNSIEAKFGYVKPLSFLQSWDKVLAQYNDIIKIDPQNTQANYWAGVIYYNRKNFAGAIKLFKAVVDLYPFDYDGNHMLGWANLMAGKKAEAKMYFNKALIIKPDDSSSNEGLSRANR